LLGANEPERLVLKEVLGVVDILLAGQSAVYEVKSVVRRKMEMGA